MQDVVPEDVEPQSRAAVEWQATRSGPTTSDAARAWTLTQSGTSASARTPRHRVRRHRPEATSRRISHSLYDSRACAEVKTPPWWAISR